MTRKLYDLKHPLYPHHDLLKYHNDHKIVYHPYQGAYDDAYNQWYQLVRADHDFSGAPLRPITREISQIIRLKSSGQEYLLYSETLFGQDHENNTIPFFHTYGQYMKPAFKTVYNYELKQANTIRSGGVETVFFLPFNKDLMEELYSAGPDNMDIELLVNVGSKQYGGRGFYTYDEFRDLALEELARIGREGKGMFTTAVTSVPSGTMAAELKASGAGTSQQQQQLWKEFQEFQKFKQNNKGGTTTTK
jgi:hypothetical protein